MILQSGRRERTTQHKKKRKKRTGKTCGKMAPTVQSLLTGSCCLILVLCKVMSSGLGSCEYKRNLRTIGLKSIKVLEIMISLGTCPGRVPTGSLCTLTEVFRGYSQTQSNVP
jgi:hypothetical protein